MAVKVLVVAGEKELLRRYQKVLSTFDIETVIAVSFQEASKIVMSEEISIVLVDLDFFDINKGLLYLVELRNYANLGLIVVSCKNGHKQIINSYKAGADVFLRKPFLDEELYLRISSLSRRMLNPLCDEYDAG